MRETDLPCTECGIALVERTVPIEDLLPSIDRSESARVADCPQCGARYYPDETLTQLYRGAHAHETSGKQ